MVELLEWWSFHEVVIRPIIGARELEELAEGYLKERQPLVLKFGEAYEQLKRSSP